jgi:NAD-dependent SIR2 family protein deacetylase/peptidyl-tRNA hydrolase
MSAEVSSTESFTGDETVLTKLVNFLDSLEYRNIVVLVGAGISTSCGIPDFRTPGTGLYSNLQKYNLPQPEAVFDIDFFRKQPEAFYKLAKELYPGKAQPSITHYFIRLLHEHGKLFRCFTQNIDGLELRAGVPAERVVQAHGSFDTASCIECKRPADTEYVRKCIFADQVPRCEEKSCQGLVKPDIVFFGEDLPPRYYERQRDLKNADAIIVMGTSLKVKPFATMLYDVDPSVPKILINNELVGQEYFLFFGGSARRDLFVGGHCDFICAHVISELWWMQRSLVKILHSEEIRDNKTGTIDVDTVGEYRMILVVNQDLLKVMKQGKVSGQVGHCVSSIVRNLERRLRGLSSGESFDSVSSVGLPRVSVSATEPEQKQLQSSTENSTALDKSVSSASSIGKSDKVVCNSANVSKSNNVVPAVDSAANDTATVNKSDTAADDNVLDQINSLINYCRWIGSCEAKIVKKAPESVLRELLLDYPHCTHSVYDAGKTQIPAGSLTVVGLVPCRKDQVPDIVQKLSLL